MPSNAFQLGKLLMSSGEVKISPESVSEEFSTIEQASSTDALASVGNAVGDQRIVGNNLYIWNGSGWYRIALINETPTWDSGGQPASSYILDRDSPQDATVITLAASDPDGLPISYSYVTSGSMDSMATISQDSSVFTVTPKTVSEVGEGVELTGSITFRASDGVNILPSVSSFTLSFIFTIENSNHTTLLATAVDTSDNSITDSSTNNYTISVNQSTNVSAGTFSPYRHGGYSFFTSGGDANYLSIPGDTSLDIYDGDYTVEAWLYPTTFNSDQSHWLSKGSTGTTREWSFSVTSDGLDVYWSTNGSNTGDSGVFISTTTNNLREWAHWCITKSGNTITVYKNGTSIGTGTFTSVYTNNGTLNIGRFMNYTGINHSYAGYISDLRIVKGAAIAPPSGGQTERLTTSVSGGTVSLLTCHLPYIVDGSTNNHAITLNGSTTIKPFTPFDNLEYAATDHGGSVSMPNDNDYLYVSHSSTLKPSGTDPFCVSFWYYPPTAPGTTRQLAGDFQVVSYPSNCPGWDILYQSGSQLDIRWGYPNYADLASGKTNSTVQVNAWNHIAFCRSGGSLSYYLNGKRCNTTTSNISISASGLANFYVGYAGEASGSAMNSAMGTIADFKYEVGTSQFDATASTITVPTAPQSTTNSVLHIKGSDVSIIDKSQGSNLKLIADTVGSTTQVKFADTKSMYFDGAGDYITIENSEAYGFGTGSWTFEVWLYCTRTGASNAIFDTRVGTGTQTGSFGIGMLSTGQVQMFSGGVLYKPAETLSFNAWQHLAIVKNASTNTTTMYFNGTAAATTYSDTRDYGSSQPVQIAKDDWVNYFGGYMQDLRVTKGLARYTANFTPPTAPLKG